MLGRLKYKITRNNREKVKRKYAIRIIVFICLSALLLSLLIFYNFFSYTLRLKPDMSKTEHGDLILHTVDVGQGLCVLIKLPNGDTMLFDTGENTAWDSLDKYISKLLLSGDDTLDYMVLSHTDSDHTGSALDVLEKYRPKKAFVPDISQAEYINAEYVEFYNKLLSSDTGVVYNTAGLKLVVGGASITWLAPSRDYYTSSNDYSVAMLVEYGDFGALITADTGHNDGLDGRVDTEAELMSFAEINNISIDIDVLYAGHHGSKYSTGEDLLNATTPTSIIIPVGENSYGHPAEDLYLRISDYDNDNNTSLFDNMYTTLSCGNIIIAGEMDGEYIIDNFSDIHEYLFVEFWIVVIILLIPIVLLLLDSILIFIKITKKEA